jgi:alpha-glucosidase
MPMMQFSVAPWRVLDKKHFAAVEKAVKIREKFTPKILELARESAHTGEPIVRSMEYVFPHQGYAKVEDQFLLGNNILVAPMLQKGEGTREVFIPKGEWTDINGKVIEGPTKIKINVPLDEIPIFVNGE